MKVRVLKFLVLAALLSACGADGEPIQPSMNANIGISNSGVHVGGGVGLSQGPFSLNLGF
ncbi:MAG: hypothetical protein MRY77_08340 [Rhodobacteraceae bacterium]|jgi:hypothetical protein|nr:hypothetical protein [Paracoccaceae bacterium]